ncbi:MAG: hypothetical protein N2Z69_06330 [Methylophilaceae bacterium]|nr:hypothetical protein [Methylophilaceae bacterium]
MQDQRQADELRCFFVVGFHHVLDRALVDDHAIFRLEIADQCGQQQQQDQHRLEQRARAHGEQESAEDAGEDDEHAGAEHETAEGGDVHALEEGAPEKAVVGRHHERGA